MSTIFSFIRSVDLSSNCFHDSNQINDVIKVVSGVRNLSINKSCIQKLPENFHILENLETLHLSYNDLEFLGDCLSKLKNLQTFVCRHNKISNYSFPSSFFQLENLTVLDLAYNTLESIPDDLDSAKNLISLNLSHNKLTCIPNQLFINLTDILFLDISHNSIETMPPQLRRLTRIKVLKLNNNPLIHAHLKSLTLLTNLESLNISDTKRTLNTVPAGLVNLKNMQDFDLSCNDLQLIPTDVYELYNIKRLHINDNKIFEISSELDGWANISILNLSRNKLKSIPTSISKLKGLTHLYLNENLLTFDGIPGSIGKLTSLKVLSLIANQLKILTEGVSRCTKLEELFLTDNSLVTLPDSIYFLRNLKILETSNNPNLVMPEKPKAVIDPAKQLGIDFSLEYQLDKCAPLLKERFRKNSVKQHDRFNRRIRMHQGWEKRADTKCVLDGMRKIADITLSETESYIENGNHNIKTWTDGLKKPNLNYNELFSDNTGVEVGLSLWEIDQFLPVEMELEDIGIFYLSDCYIILSSTRNATSRNLDYNIYYLIGPDCSIDKATCAAMHAVNLRNMISAQCRTVREEMQEESDEFLMLFPHGLQYLPGAHSSSGLFTLYDPIKEHHFFAVTKDDVQTRPKYYLIPYPYCYKSLSSSSIYILISNDKIMLWIGENVPTPHKIQTKLLVTSICNTDYQKKPKIVEFERNHEPSDFMNKFHSNCNECNNTLETSHSHNKRFPILYTVEMGSGYLQLIQIAPIYGIGYEQNCLKTDRVYVMDTFYTVSVWFGRKSSRLVRSAALKMSNEIMNLIKRPKHAIHLTFMEGKEKYIFRCNFYKWDNIDTVNYSKTKHVLNSKSNISVDRIEKKEKNSDMSALFRKRCNAEDYPEMFNSEWNIDFDRMYFLVYEKRTFVKLPQKEVGQFYSKNCYVIMTYYTYLVESVNSGVESSETLKKSETDESNEQTCHVYFWQGRDAGNTEWISFSLSLKKRLSKSLNHEVVFQRVYQQQEDVNFLGNFPNGIIIKSGDRKDTNYINQCHSFQCRFVGSSNLKRCVEIQIDSNCFNSHFVYIIYIASEFEKKCIIWEGSEASKILLNLAQNAGQYFNTNVTIISETNQPHFLNNLYNKQIDVSNYAFIDNTRLFRCSFEKGYFTVSEKFIDFCQDDLNEEDVMLLDNGQQIYVWIGNDSSDIELTCALRSSKLYREYITMENEQDTRIIRLASHDNPPVEFTQCFLGWSHYTTTVRD
ncbi:Adseverin [Intoshia linei]|uniref:Adseverin n=1 Tax=Intoshia linei TaxID=1819745 RepID=A0A177BD45_9BILA|nr:Adseverin [Intoshia linei]